MPTINAWVFIVNLCVVAAIAGLSCFTTEELDGKLLAILWLGSPYLGHCGLVLTCRRNRGASALVLAWTLVTVAGIVSLIVHEWVSEGTSGGRGPHYETMLGLFVLVLPVLQWIVVVILGIILMLVSHGRAPVPPPKPSRPLLGDLE